MSLRQLSSLSCDGNGQKGDVGRSKRIVLSYTRFVMENTKDPITMI